MKSRLLVPGGSGGGSYRGRASHPDLGSAGGELLNTESSGSLTCRTGRGAPGPDGEVHQGPGQASSVKVCDHCLLGHHAPGHHAAQQRRWRGP